MLATSRLPAANGDTTHLNLGSSNMKNIASVFLSLVSSCLTFIAAPSSAMMLEVQGNMLFATGPVGDDLLKFEDAIAKGGITTVVFVNSPGGDLWTGLRVGRLIADKGYNTVIAGSCVSACSIMFMGGKERRFSSALRPAQTLIGIHGAHNTQTKGVDLTQQPQIFAFYKQHMGDKFNAAVMNQALYQMEDAGSLLRVFDPVRSAKTLPYHCVSSQTPRSKCTSFPDTDAQSLGIITHTDLVSLNLPPAFNVIPTVMGQPLDMLFGDLPGYLADLAQKQCLNASCKTATLNWQNAADHRAIATAVSGQGQGLSINRENPMAAVIRAIFVCNHLANRSALLCEAEAVNAYDLRPLYKTAQASHAAALVTLKVPTDKFYANEEFGGGFTAATGLRTQKMIDITPGKIDGIEVVGTQALAAALLSKKPGALIDVIGSFETVPQSLVLVGAGQALEDPAQDALLEKRIAGLLALLAPDPAAPLIFFCSGRNSWLSVNAALRAKKLGYTNVQWYRGGVESWKAAGLPTATSVVRAVAR
jgi:rhodanese-related sulfurtransferase